MVNADSYFPERRMMPPAQGRRRLTGIRPERLAGGCLLYRLPRTRMRAAGGQGAASPGHVPDGAIRGYPTHEERLESTISGWDSSTYALRDRRLLPAMHEV